MVLSYLRSLPSGSGFRQYLHWHYALNVFASLAYILTRVHPTVCQAFYTERQPEDCELDYHDSQILIFLAFVLVVKNRKWKPINANDFLPGLFLFAKATNVVLFMRKDARYGSVYILFWLVIFLLFPEPSYRGPDEIQLFRGQALDEELLHNPGTTWLVEFYTTWSPPCTRFSGTFAALSLRYNHNFLKFGKINCSAYEVIARKYGVDVAVQSKNLPSLILFEDGKEKIRRPIISADGTIKPYLFTIENIIRDFNLNEYLDASKKKLKTKKDKVAKKDD